MLGVTQCRSKITYEQFRLVWNGVSDLTVVGVVGGKQF